jgi:predicted ATPase/DNA-binding CsgD family transcriptional regulator
MSYLIDENGRAPLTQREVEVIELVADGLTNQEIADSMVITVHTVKAHLKHIFAKLEASNRTEAVACARELGFLSDAPIDTVQTSQSSHNLPRSLIPLIGRDYELAVLSGYLNDVNKRLITLHGPGGVGKTHLAIEVAWQHLSSFRDGVFMVALAPLESSLFLLSAIAEALGFRFSNQEKLKEQLLAYLSDKQMLLVMDGFERLLDHTALIGEMLATAPELTVIVTSRERLNFHGEILYSLQGVSYSQELNDETNESDAVTLFNYCAERILPGFQPDATELVQIAEICQIVEGLPLAILLAASWANAMSIQDILAEIQQRHARFLVTAEFNTYLQYRELSYVFQGSWDLLEPYQQDAFMRLTVFPGSFTRKAAQHVTDASPRVLSALVNKAMIEWDPSHRRYRTHRLLRQYIIQYLEQSGEADTTRDAHMDYYADAMQAREIDLKGRDQLGALNDIESDFDNVRAAWYWALEQRRYDAINRMVETLFWFCLWRCHLIEGRELFRQAREKLPPQDDQAPHPVWGRILVRGARLAKEWFHPSLQPDFELALEIARQYDDQAEIAFCLSFLGAMAEAIEDFEVALDLLEKSLEHYRALDDRFGMARVLHRMGAAMGRRAGDAAYNLTRQALELRREIGDVFGTMRSLINLAIHYCLDLGEFEEGERMNREIMSLARQTWGYSLTLVIAQQNLALYCAFMHRGDLEETRQLAEESIEIATKIHNITGRGIGLSIIGALAAMEDDYVTAKQLCLEGFSFGGARDMSATRDITTCLMMAHCGLGEYQEVRRLAHEYRFLQYRPLHIIPGLAVAEAYEGDKERAVELLGLVFTHPKSPKGWIAKWPLLTRLRDELCTELGEETYNAAWERGKNRDLGIDVENPE